MSKHTNKLRFPSGRVKAVVRSRHALARRIVTSGEEWAKLHPSEEGAASTLVEWGMLERHAQTPNFVRWSILHERPLFGPLRRSLGMYGTPVHQLSETQVTMIGNVNESRMMRRVHDVLTLGDRPIQRMLKQLEARGLILVERRAGGVWRLKIAPTYPGYIPLKDGT